MTDEEIRAYCLSKPGAYEDLPFGPTPVCYKLNGRVFAQLYPGEGGLGEKITLKCTLEQGQFYRRVYPGQVMRGYHCPPVQQPYWNTVLLEGFPDGELLQMIDLAYEAVFFRFSKKVQQQLKAGL